MPGVIVSSNADLERRSQAIWEPRQQKYMFRDYSMSVTSRSINYWAFGVSALLLPAIPVVLIIAARRRRRGRI
jgi:hypothetical protein